MFKKPTKFLLLIFMFLLTSCNINANEGNLKLSTEEPVLSEFKFFEVIFANVEEGQSILGSEDEYTMQFTYFDLMCKPVDNPNTVEGYLKSSQNQVLEWTEKEKDIILESVKDIQNKMGELGILHLDFPDTLYFIKTTGKEEGDAYGYTRGNSIILKEKYFSKMLITHELFHIVSRYNKDIAEEIYQVFGFNKSNIVIPDFIRRKIITNPDAIDLGYSINVNHDESEKSGVLIMYSDREYEGGSFFNYLNLGLYFEGEKIVSLENVEGFHEQIGANTGYIVHPEEIAAEHFMMIILENNDEKPNPELLDEVLTILRKKRL